MKKTMMFLAVAFLTASAHGASIAWNVANIAFNGSKITDATTEFTASLFYLGSNGTLAGSYSASDIEGLTIKESETGTTSKGANTGTYTLKVGIDKNDDVFGMLLSYTTGGKTYYNIAPTTYKLSGFSDAGSVVEKYTVAANTMSYGTKNDSATSVTPGGGWAAVPEPSTAMLALAGLALLIKRRRA